MSNSTKNRLRELRKNKNETIDDIAKIIGVSRATINNYERGTHEPKLETWQKLADYFGVPVGYIQGVTDDIDGYDLWEDATGYNKKDITDIIAKLQQEGVTTGDTQKDIGLAVSTLEGMPSGFGTASAVKYATGELGAIRSNTEAKYFTSADKIKNAPDDEKLVLDGDRVKLVLSSKNNFGEDYYYDGVDPRVMRLIDWTMSEAKDIVQLGANGLASGQAYEDTWLPETLEELEKQLRKLFEE